MDIASFYSVSICCCTCAFLLYQRLCVRVDAILSKTVSGSSMGQEVTLGLVLGMRRAQRWPLIASARTRPADDLSLHLDPSLHKQLPLSPPAAPPRGPDTPSSPAVCPSALPPPVRSCCHPICAISVGEGRVAIEHTDKSLHFTTGFPHVLFSDGVCRRYSSCISSKIYIVLCNILPHSHRSPG